jgi:septum formation protein
MNRTPPTGLYLASGSPRRRELLRQLGVHFQLVSAPVDETPAPQEDAARYVQRLAALKAGAGWDGLDPARRAPVLGADTTVLLDGRILGKPAGPAALAEMLALLSGRTHTVLTGIALRTGRGLTERLSRSEVTFCRIDAAAAGDYWDTGEPADKAGGYAIQGFGARFVQHLSGSFSGVMGLPLFETAQLLDEAGVPLWQSV